jgi:hypothetical protein
MNARELSNRLAALLRNERTAMADFLVALADFDREKRWRDLGHASLFAYLRRELGLSAGAAQYRKTAAELIQNLPAVERALRDGRLCLSTIIEVAKVLTPENQDEVLPRFFGLSRREAESVAVSIRPVEVIPQRSVVTQVRAPAPTSPAGAAPTCDARDSIRPQSNRGLGPDLFRPAEIHSESVSGGPAPAPAPAPVHVPPHDSVDPLDGSLSRVHWTVSRRFLAKLDAARDALSHAKPGATTEEILEAGLDLVLAAHAKRKGLVEKPLAKPRPWSRKGYIPAHVRREVWKRDGGKCQWRLDSGELCGSTYQVEVDHIDLVALGGVATVETCRCLCRGHNQLHARQVLGDAVMDRYAREPTPDRVREPEAVYAGAPRASDSTRKSTARRSAQKLGQKGQPDTNATWPPASVASILTCGFRLASSTGMVSPGTMGSSSEASARRGRRTPARNGPDEHRVQ